MIAKTILIGLTAVALATPAAAQSGGIGAAETSPNLSPNAGGPVGSTTVPRGNNPSTLDVGRQGDCAPEQEAASEQAAGSGNDASHEGVDRQSC
jgi:hypothetical protein